MIRKQKERWRRRSRSNFISYINDKGLPKIFYNVIITVLIFQFVFKPFNKCEADFYIMLIQSLTQLNMNMCIDISL